MQRIRFGIDIDGTITTHETMLKMINHDFNLQLKIEDIKMYDMNPYLNEEPQIISQWFKKNVSLMYSQSPLADGAKMVMNKWTEIGDLYFISARNVKLHDITLEWFRKNELQYHTIDLIGSHNKIQKIKDYHLDIFFEDKHDNAVNIYEECQIPVILFNTPYNQGATPKGVIRVENWFEAEKWVLDWQNSKQ